MVDTVLDQLRGILGSDVFFPYYLHGEARQGADAGHEHFGYMDGIAQPAVKGFTTDPRPGQPILDPGLFLLGEAGDTTTRPSWAKGGSMMAFRQLQQQVPGK
jgi:deferrochelatase/peroxidase EfeB